MNPGSITVDDDAGSSVDLEVLGSLAGHVLSRLHIDPASEVGISLVDVERMSRLHQEWMGEPGPTDVLSFPMDEMTPGSQDRPSGPGILGDVVICPQIAATDAASAGRDEEGQIQFLMVHGLLHLLGFDHATDEDRNRMFALQDTLLLSWRNEE